MKCRYSIQGNFICDNTVQNWTFTPSPVNLLPSTMTPGSAIAPAPAPRIEGFKNATNTELIQSNQDAQAPNGCPARCKKEGMFFTGNWDTISGKSYCSCVKVKSVTGQQRLWSDVEAQSEKGCPSVCAKDGLKFSGQWANTGTVTHCECI